MKILVVEDDKLLAEALVGVLSNQHYAVEVANDGHTGWQLIEAFDYDLIILDVLLPGLDGISLCQQIRSQGKKMPILLLTGRDRTHDKAVGLDAGADDYLVKPFEAEELVARIRALLRRNASIQTVLEWEKLRLEPICCEVTYNGRLLTLTPKEYALLELFLRNSRRVFSCGAILEHLWSYEDIPGEEAVRTHIKGLRHKLKAVGATHNFIETVYGIGYRLKPIDEKTIQANKPFETGDANPELTAQMLASVGIVWNRFKGRISEQVAVIEQAYDAYLHNSLNPELQENAAREAHTLAGSLGTFGFPEGSKAARKIEKLLKSDIQLENCEITKLGELVTVLRQQIEQNSSQQVSINENPLLLIVDDDKNLTQEIERVAVDFKLRVTIAETIKAAKNKLYQEHPNIVLLDPHITPNRQDSFDFFKELKARKPPVPLIAYSAETDFNSRLEIARHGTRTFLEKPVPILQVLEKVQQVLQAQDADAKILVVDDDPKTLALLQTLLQPWGLQVQTLGNPNYFWGKLESVQPDLLILDVEMPDISGIEICQVVRNDPKWSELPILFLTVHSDAETVNRVFASGADDFVTKPIIGPELVTRIINRLERMKLQRRIAKTYPELQKQVAEMTAINQTLQNQLNVSIAQDALQKSEALFAGIVSIADDAIITIDSNQCISLFNEGAEKIFGYMASEVLGKSLDLLLPSRYTQAHHQHVRDFGKSPKKARRMGERREIYGCRKDGSEFAAEASISKLNVGDEILYTVYLQDISERKQIERMKDEFVSVVSHELRTPLTSIHGSLGMLASGLIEPGSEKGKRLLQIATDSTQRLVRLINDILNIERIESGKVKLEKQTCNVEDLVNKAIALMQPIAEKANIVLLVKSIYANILVDSDLIIQTLTNLLSNAIKFSELGSTVWLTVEIGRENIFTSNSDSTPYILFKIKDNGRGIPTDKLDTIFERFQQVDSSDSRNYDGTGLGLAICRSIIEQHHGKIWAESTLDVGSTFNVAIPLPTSEHANLEIETPKKEVSNSHVLLVCQDDLEIARELQTLLEKHEYRAISVTNTKEATNLSAFTKENTTQEFEQRVIGIIQSITQITVGNSNDETYSGS